MGQPHSKYRHLFVVVRLNKPFQIVEDIEQSENDVMITKAYFERKDAEQEAERLNEQNEGFWHYFVCTARLVDQPNSTSQSH